MEIIENISSTINGIVWGPIMIALILVTGIILSVRQRMVQVVKFPYSCKMTIGKNLLNGQKVEGGGVSQFQAFSAAIAGTVGTGNVVGVATALVSGGAGAIFWMWVSAFFGMCTSYTEKVLGIYFRKREENGEPVGGPMYYISEGVRLKKFSQFGKILSLAFCVFCVFASFGYGATQANSISGTLFSAFSVPTYITGIVVAVVVGIVIVGGIKRIGKIASIIVPFMAVIFIIMALVIIGMNITAVGSAFGSIFGNAFNFSSVAGGIAGYHIMTSMRYGMARGIFSNEAGLGSSVMAHSASNVKEPVEQGLWGIFEVFFDTFIICTLMAIVLIATGAFGTTDASGNLLSGATLANYAFSTASLGTFGNIAFAIILPLFAFTTILSWSFYGEKAVTYIFGKKSKIPFRIIYLASVVLGAVASLDLVWEIADTFNALMALPNLIGLIMLSGLAGKITKNYFDRKKGIDVEPMLSAYGDEMPIVDSSNDEPNEPTESEQAVN